ncbi:VOC family protein, partial [Erwinia amylovora]|nr:VOC family protein [Erwinia amylovora]
KHGIGCEALRGDPLTGKLITFLNDPDALPLELYQA